MKNLPNRVLAAIVAIISVFAVLLVIFSSGNTESEFKPGTPEWTVQQFLTAMVAGDTDEAVQYLAPSSPCKIIHLDRAWLDRNINVDLVESVITDSRARVEVDVEYSSSDLFGTPYVESHVYRLERSGNEWLLTGIPWPLYDCGQVTK